MPNRKAPLVRFALPSKGKLEKATLDFLAASGLEVLRLNERQYIASIPSVPQLEVLFQRALDIVSKVDEGSADLGITGYDILCEQAEGYDDVLILCKNLGYGSCELVLAVPESWLDVSSFDDFAELTILFKQKGRDIRVATKYPSLVRKWFYERGVFHFSLVEVQGALEVAPGLGYADAIADLTSSGTTLRENHLKRLSGGTILESQACLIGNKRHLQEKTDKLDTTRLILELMEAHLRAKKLISLTANIRGESAEVIARNLMKERALCGPHGPAIAKVYSKIWGEDDWYTTTIVVEEGMLLRAVDHLRKAGGTDIMVFSPNSVFDSKSWNYQSVIENLKRDHL